MAPTPQEEQTIANDVFTNPVILQNIFHCLQNRDRLRYERANRRLRNVALRIPFHAPNDSITIRFSENECCLVIGNISIELAYIEHEDHRVMVNFENAIERVSRRIAATLKTLVIESHHPTSRILLNSEQLMYISVHFKQLEHISLDGVIFERALVYPDSLSTLPVFKHLTRLSIAHTTCPAQALVEVIAGLKIRHLKMSSHLRHEASSDKQLLTVLEELASQSYAFEELEIFLRSNELALPIAKAASSLCATFKLAVSWKTADRNGGSPVLEKLSFRKLTHVDLSVSCCKLGDMQSTLTAFTFIQLMPNLTSFRFAPLHLERLSVADMYRVGFAYAIVIQNCKNLIDIELDLLHTPSHIEKLDKGRKTAAYLISSEVLKSLKDNIQSFSIHNTLVDDHHLMGTVQRLGHLQSFRISDVPNLQPSFVDLMVEELHSRVSTLCVKIEQPVSNIDMYMRGRKIREWSAIFEQELTAEQETRVCRQFEFVEYSRFHNGCCMIKAGGRDMHHGLRSLESIH